MGSSVAVMLLSHDRELAISALSAFIIRSVTMSKRWSGSTFYIGEQTLKLNKTDACTL